MKLGKEESSIEVKLEKKAKTGDAVSDQFLPSKLHQQTQSLIKFIYNKELMEKSVTDVGYDVKKLPLGQLSDETIKTGYECLTNIEKILL